MICPNCKADSVPFLPVWLKGSFGSQTCGQCEAEVRMKRTPAVIISSLLIGILIGITPFVIDYATDWSFLSWRTLFIFLAVILLFLVIDGIKDYFLIELVAAPAKTTRIMQ